MGDQNDGGLRIQIVDYGTMELTVDAIDYGSGNPNPSPQGSDPGSQSTPRSRQVRLLGQTDLGNSDIVDPTKNGAGLLNDIVQDPQGVFKGPNYVEGQADCMDFAQAAVKKLLPQLGSYEELEDWVGLWKAFVPLKYTGTGRAPATGQLRLGLRKVTDYGDSSKNIVTLYEWGDNGDLKLVSQGPQQSKPVLQDTASTPDSDPDPIAYQWEETQPSIFAGNFGSFENPLTSDAEKPPASPWDVGSCKRSTLTRLGRRCASHASAGVSDLALARVGGALSSITLATQAATEAAGIAGAALGAVVVILDFANGNWLGGAFGALGLVLGVVATLAVAGPVGWLLGGLVTALFAILPGLFGSPATLPAAKNITQIIQWKTFGDASHTGNEECRKQNPACQAVYGPGVVAMVFGWNYFDASVFLINFNQGFPMTIPDMAAAFQFNGTQGAAAVVDCHNGKWVAVAQHSAAGGYEGDNPEFCNHPEFSMSRDVVIPVINQSANEVYDRIIPAPGGDCKIIDGASNAVNYTSYNLTLTGLPVSISCNISAAIDYNGIALPVGAPTPPNGSNMTSTGNSSTVSSNNTFVSPANGSTDHVPGGYVAPPGPVPFQIPFNSTTAPCFSGTSGTACFPNGTYDQPDGTFGFTLDGVTNLSIPTDSSASVTISNMETVNHHYFQTTQMANKVFNTSVNPPSNKALLDAIKYQNVSGQDPQFTVNVPTAPPPAACIFTKAQYRGDQACLGIGGGNLSAPLVNTAHSIQVLGGATVWIYAAAYGDGGGQKLTASVPDLATEPYGPDQNFNGKVMAMWVQGVD